jgi:hypothetical protein
MAELDTDKLFFIVKFFCDILNMYFTYYVLTYSLGSNKCNTIDSLCETNLSNHRRKKCELEKCFWHKDRQVKSEKLQEEENKDVSSPKLPNAGSQLWKRVLSSESSDH